jgi:hypothetical protein
MADPVENRAAPRSDLTLVYVFGGLVLVCACMGLCLLGIALGSIAYLSTLQNHGTPISAWLFMEASPTPHPTPLPAAPGDGAYETGQVYTIPEQSRNHVASGTFHVPYTTDPPTSGPHWSTPLSAGVYTSVEADESIVHSLEHGYVVIYYNCTRISLLPSCSDVVDQLQAIYDSYGGYKIIAVPRPDMPYAIALTSWMRLAYLDDFDVLFIQDFINTNRESTAPEPSGP